MSVSPCPRCGHQPSGQAPAGADTCCPRCGLTRTADPKSETATVAVLVPKGAAEPPPPQTLPAEDLDLGGLLQPPQQPDEMGRLGPYRVLKVLGAGGMGIVFQAEDPQLKRAVALKVLRPALAASATARRRFLREAQAVAALEHDNIVTIYQVGEDRLPFLAMPLLRGETLQARIERAGKLPPGEVLRIGRETARGLAAAHEHGLIHRDIKPSNLWLEAGPGGAPGGRVKILDFGLARRAEGSEETQLSRPGVLCGTPLYMAPEQARGEAVDHRADLFSLGCVLYRLCTGDVPFKGSTTMSVLRALELEQPQPPRKLAADVPPGLSALILRLLAKDPNRRPATAREVADSLQQLEESSRPGTRAPGSAAGPAGPRSLLTGRRLVLLAGAGLVAGAAAGGVLLLGKTGKAPAPQGDGAPPAPRLRLLVPAYFYPGGPGLEHWEKLLASAGSVPITAIVNPASGPGKQSDADYAQIVDRANQAGVVPIGYVRTNYARQPLAEVKADVERWLEFYPAIRGFFFDEQASGAGEVEYYVKASAHARSRLAQALVVGNPGTVCAEEYLSHAAADVVCLTEGSGLHQHLPSWVDRQGPGRLAVLLYRVQGAGQARQLIQEITQQRLGFVYATDADQPNPWERLPSWWQEEVAAVREADQA
jgi:hypothetical protein